MKNACHYALLLLLTTSTTIVCYAQNELQVFGFFQGNAQSFHSQPTIVSVTTPEVRSNHFGITQANLFLSKGSDIKVSGFLNLEFTNNYSSDRQWGSFNLQEAFVRYDYADYLVVKFGYFIPAFNSMYEIYNRTPLLPYLFRPLLYETQCAQVTNIFTVLPSRAVLQLSGFAAPFRGLKIDYAAHAGNPADEYIESRTNTNGILEAYIPYGQNANKYISGGGRLGLRTKYLTLGGSYTFDYNNKQSFQLFFEDTATGGFGDLPRHRIGADLTASFWRLSLNAEYLYSTSPLKQEQKDSLMAWSQNANAQVGKDFDVNSFYVTLQYDITDQLFVYGMYNLFRDNFHPFLVGIDGLHGESGGAGYRVSDDLVLKLQVVKNKSTFITEAGTVTLNDMYYMTGCSYAF